MKAEEAIVLADADEEKNRTIIKIMRVIVM